MRRRASVAALLFAIAACANGAGEERPFASPEASRPTPEAKVVPLGSTAADINGWLGSYDELVFESGTYRFGPGDVIAVPSGKRLVAAVAGETTFAGPLVLRVRGEVLDSVVVTRAGGIGETRITTGGALRAGESVVLREDPSLYNGQNRRKGLPQQLVTVAAVVRQSDASFEVTLDRPLAYRYDAGEQRYAYRVAPVEDVEVAGINFAEGSSLDLALVRRGGISIPRADRRGGSLRMEKNGVVASDQVTLRGVWEASGEGGAGNVVVQVVGLSRSRLQVVTRGGRKDGIHVAGCSDLDAATLEAHGPSHRGIHLWQVTGHIERAVVAESGWGVEPTANLEAIVVDHSRDLLMEEARAVGVRAGDGIEVRGPSRRVRIRSAYASEDTGNATNNGASGLNLHAWGGEDIQVDTLEVYGFHKPLRIGDGGNGYRILGGRIDKAHKRVGEAVVIGEGLSADLTDVRLENLVITTRGVGPAIHARDHRGSGHRIRGLTLRAITITHAGRVPYMRLDDIDGLDVERVSFRGARRAAIRVGQGVTGLRWERNDTTESSGVVQGSLRSGRRRAAAGGAGRGRPPEHRRPDPDRTH